MIETRVYNEIIKRAGKIKEENAFIDPDDAVIMATAYELVYLFDDFLENVLLVRYAEGDLYAAETTIHDFIQARNQILMILMDVGLAVSAKYPNVARVFFADRIDSFKEHIKGINMDGNIKQVYDLQSDFHLFYRLIDGGIMSHQLEHALKSFEGLAPDAAKLYMKGLSNLGSGARVGRYVFDAMVSIGRGTPMTISEIASETQKAKPTINKGIEEILKNAGHLIRVEQRGQYNTYFIPEEYRRLHIR